MLLKPDITDKKAFDIISKHINIILSDFLSCFLDEYLTYGFDDDDIDSYVKEVFPKHYKDNNKRKFLENMLKESEDLENFYELTPLKCFIIFKIFGRELNETGTDKICKNYSTEISGKLTDYPNCENSYRYEEFVHPYSGSIFSYFNILRLGDCSDRQYVLSILEKEAFNLSNEEKEIFVTNSMRNIEDITMFPIAYFDDFEFMELEES